MMIVAMPQEIVKGMNYSRVCMIQEKAKEPIPEEFLDKAYREALFLTSKDGDFLRAVGLDKDYEFYNIAIASYSLNRHEWGNININKFEIRED